MSAIGPIPDASEGSLRDALSSVAPELAGLPIKINPRHRQSNPLYWSASAVIDEVFVVKYAWSEVRATRVWREGVVLHRLLGRDVPMALPDVVALSRAPALLVTRLVVGEPLSWEWASGLSGPETGQVGGQLAQFLARLHDVDAAGLLVDLPEVEPTPQADPELLRRRFPRLLDERRSTEVQDWCRWAGHVLNGSEVTDEVLVHGDFHGYNQVWDRTTSVLRAVVDFEESGISDPHFDLRYLPGSVQGPALVWNVMNQYESFTGRQLTIERVLAWHVLTHLGDALWRTEAGVPLPGGGTATSWVDDLQARLFAFDLP